ncbi:MAG: hypothetical protein IT335_07760 [Thermomicrobiales bacterium]|jgi:hypothetical protein|nr:hypothetical protein [Thermomicrobiales bacterium]
MKRWIAAIAASAFALTIVIGGFSELVRAQDESATPLPELETVDEQSVSFTEALAAELGISVDALEVAIDNAQTTSGTNGFGGKRGSSGGPDGDHRSGGNRGDGGRSGGSLGGFSGVTTGDLATFLGVTEDDIRADRESGLNIVEIAESHGKTESDLRAFLIEQATARIDERLAGLAEDSVTEEGGTPAASA